jgi:hypothetical protein
VAAVLQWVAAIVVLIAFALSQWGLLSTGSYRYLVANCVGGAGLSVAAAITHQWGFVLLEGVWSLVAAWSLLRRLRGLPAGVGPPSDRTA